MTAAGPTLDREEPASDRFARWLSLVVAGAVAVRWTYVKVVDPRIPDLGDPTAYHLLAANLAEGRGYIRPYDFLEAGQRFATAEYPPLFPFLLSLADRAGIESVDGQRLFMGVFGGATVAVIGLLGRRVGGVAVGLVAAAVAAVYPMLFQAEAALMPETLASLAAALMVLLALRATDGLRSRADRRGDPTSTALVAAKPHGFRARRADLSAQTLSPARFVFLGVAAGAATLVRAEALLLLPLLLLPFLVRGAADLSARRRLLLASVAVAAAAAIVLPWTIRNAVTYGRLVPVSNNVGSVIRGANCDLAYSGSFRGLWVTNVDPDAQLDLTGCFGGFDVTADQNEAESAAELRSEGLRYARDHAGSVPAVMAVRWGRTFGVAHVRQQTAFESLEGRDLDWQRRGTATYYGVALLGIAGAVVLVRRRDPAWWPLAATVVAVSVTTMVTYGNQRFRAGAEPALVVLAAVALVAGARRLLGQSARSGGPGR